MKLFVLHYHLHPGGVGRVIESQLASLAPFQDRFPVELLTGTAPADAAVSRKPAAVEPALGYLDPGIAAPQCRDLRRRLLDFFNRTLSGADILHVHNPNLGKNPVLTVVLSDLAARGRKLLLHCHDFAEDRPRNLEFMERVVAGIFHLDLESVMYPDAPACRFAVLSTRDAARLTGRGIRPARVHLLPNPIKPPENVAPGEAAACRDEMVAALGLAPGLPAIVYPVRAIRRKNLGEFILFAALFRERANWIVTRAPRNPAERPLYREWKRFARETGANVTFEAGHRLPFRSIMLGADRAATTSTAEGFGMAFLEPWMFGRPVVGRNIPDLTRDFVDNGLRFPYLYDFLPAPGGRATRDFASLAPARQQPAIRRLQRDAGLREGFLAETGLERLLLGPASESVIERNRNAIGKAYSVAAYGRRLGNLYEEMSGTARAA